MALTLLLELCLVEYVDNFPVDNKATMDVTCKKIKGVDGKTYWAPEDPTAIAKFVTGQK